MFSIAELDRNLRLGRWRLFRFCGEEMCPNLESLKVAIRSLADSFLIKGCNEYRYYGEQIAKKSLVNQSNGKEIKNLKEGVLEIKQVLNSLVDPNPNISSWHISSMKDLINSNENFKAFCNSLLQRFTEFCKGLETPVIKTKYPATTLLIHAAHASTAF